MCAQVTKTVAVSGALVLTTIVGHMTFDAPLDGNISLGCCLTIVAIFGYRDDTELESSSSTSGKANVGV
jgi:hypothetical protein